MTSIEMAKEAARLLSEKKGTDITAIEIRDLTTIGDYFVIASGGSNAQVKALSDAVEEGLQAGLRAAPHRGLPVGHVGRARLLRRDRPYLL